MVRRGRGSAPRDERLGASCEPTMGLDAFPNASSMAEAPELDSARLHSDQARWASTGLPRFAALRAPRLPAPSARTSARVEDALTFDA